MSTGHKNVYEEEIKLNRNNNILHLKKYFTAYSAVLFHNNMIRNGNVISVINRIDP